MKTWTKNRLLSLVSVFFISFFSLFYQYSFQVSAAQTGGSASTNSNEVDSLTDYILSAFGVCYRTAESIKNIYNADLQQSPYTIIRDYVNNALGNNDGIYEDSDGNYVFSNSFTKNILDALQNSQGYNARVITDFSVFSNFLTTPYVSNEYVSFYASDLQYARTNWDSKFLIQSFQINQIGTDVYCTGFTFYDMRNVSFVLPSGNIGGYGNTTNLAFYNSSGQNINVPCLGFHCTSRPNGFTNANTRYSGTVRNVNSTCYGYGAYYYGEVGYELLSTYNNASSLVYTFTPRFQFDVSSGGYYNFENFPSYPQNTTNGLSVFQNIYCSNSLVIGETVPDATAGIRDNGIDKVIYDNSVTNLNKISKTVIQNNDWRNIYNNQVISINNEYTTTGGSNLTKTQVQNIVTQQTSKLIAAINSGISNLEEAISFVNDWLERINYKIGELHDVLVNLSTFIQNNGSSSGDTVSGSACVWTESDISEIFDLLEEISGKPVYSDADVLNAISILDSSLTTISQRLLTLGSTVNNIYTGIISDSSIQNDILSAIHSESAINYQIYQNQATAQQLQDVQLRLVELDTVLNQILQEIKSTGVITSENEIEETTHLTANIYPTVVNTGWNMAKSNDPTYYRIYEINGSTKGKISTVGNTRTRILLTNYEPSEFQTHLNDTQSFSIQGTSTNLSDNVSSYEFTNPLEYKYLYVYCGNTLGTGTIVIETKEIIDKVVTVPIVSPDILDKLVNLATDKIEDLADTVDVVGDVLSNTVPFCFIPMIGVALNVLSTPYEVPIYTFPIDVDAINLHYVITLDFTMFLQFRTIWVSIVCIMFIFGLIAFSFNIFKTFGVLTD